VTNALTEEQLALRDALHRILLKMSSPDRVRAAEHVGFDDELWHALVSFGVPSIALAGDAVDLSLVAAESGRFLASVPVVESLVATRILGADMGNRVPTIALQPVVDGVARLVPGGAVADVVVALDGDELVAIADAPTRRTVRNLGAAAVADRFIDGDREVLAKGDEARARFEAAIVEWRALTAAALAGLSRAALDLGTEYAKERNQFSVPIGSYQAIQQQLADVATEVEGAELLAFDAAARGGEGLSIMAFAFATETARHTTAVALHIHGGYGFMLEYDVQLYFRRASAWPLALTDPRVECARLGRLLPVGDAADGTTGFRSEVRAFLAAHLTDATRERSRRTGTVHDWEFHRAMAKRGWLDATWRLDAFHVQALKEELGRAGAPIDGWGTSDLVAHTIDIVGTDEQRSVIVPRVLNGEIVICLGYSEPDAGSDVAAVRTRAARDGDQWVIDGQKMFTTLAHEATYVFLLARTNPDVGKHRGLTLFLVPMDAPGIEVRPIETLGGERTNVTFYSGVRVSDAWRVGDIDGGWNVMKVALAFERNPLALADSLRLLDHVIDWASRTGSFDNPFVAERVGRLAIDVEVGRLLARKMAQVSEAGDLPTVEGSMAKLWTSEALVRHASAFLDCLVPEAIVQDGPASWAEQAHRHAPVTTIYAGTSEIQRSIIAERGLGLPRAR
jgi:3-oxochol-4-en-24-oyl-CoA dehydrogenase